MQTELNTTFPAFDLVQAAREFAGEVPDAAERSKKNIASPKGLQCFFLYIRANGNVPFHQVTGAITVQTIIGHASFTAEGTTYSIPQGAIVSVADNVPHALTADEESVLLVTRAMQQ